MGMYPKPDPAIVRSRREAGTARALAAFQSAFSRDSALATSLTQKGLQIAGYNLLDGAVGSIALEDDAVTQAKIAAAAVLAPELGVTAGTVTNQRALVPDGSGNINTLGITGAATLASAASATVTAASGNSAVANIASGVSATANVGPGNGAVVNLAGGSGAQFGVFAATAVGQQTVTGSRGGNAALADLLAKLATYGIVVDSTSA